MTLPYLEDLQRRAAALAVSEGHPVRIVLAFYPTAESVSVEESYGDSMAGDPGPFSQKLQEAAARLGFTYIDLAGGMRSWSATSPFLYFQNQHMTARGQDAVAEMLALKLWAQAAPAPQP
jgi:hypothetical protein